MAVKAGQEVLAQLVQKADVLVENFKLGTLEKWGITDAWLERRAPRVIRCSITGYGSSGPDAALPGYDFILQAESGLMSICGEPDGTPTKYGVAIVDVVTGLYACNAILAALAARNRTGRGQHLELCLYDSGIAMLINVASNYLVSGKDARRYGNGHPSIVPYTTYPTADGLVAVAVGNDAQFARFAETVGHAEWGRDSRFAKNPDRVTNREALDALIAQALKRELSAAWMVRTVKHPKVGDLKMVGMPFRFSDTPEAIRRAPPLLGQHTEEVLGAELGLSAERIAQLRADKVI
jgi:crotonobetainyl-CoA:carnitine CoA-transferase CaiB-like acyl-CoA transferase